MNCRALAMPFLDASALDHDPDRLAFLKAVIARAPCHASEAVAQRASTHTGSRAAGSVLLPSAITPEDIQATMANGTHRAEASPRGPRTQEDRHQGRGVKRARRGRAGLQKSGAPATYDGGCYADNDCDAPPPRCSGRALGVRDDAGGHETRTRKSGPAVLRRSATCGIGNAGQCPRTTSPPF